MKKLTILIILLSFVMIGFTSCKKATSITCNLAKADKAPVNMTITFKAISTGDGTISSLTYKTSTKEETISNPALPWSITADAAAGTDVSIAATGTTKDGSLIISYEGKSGGSEISGQDFCSHSNN